jgi:hypothetical protein
MPQAKGLYLQSQLLRRLRQKGHLSPGVSGQSGATTTIIATTKKASEAEI